MDEKLSNRKAETVASFLRRVKGIKMAVSVIRYKTPVQVAEMALGKVPKIQIRTLAEEICREVNIPVAEAAP